MKHRNDNMLLRIAQGDAFAIAVEFVKRSEHSELYEAAYRLDSFHQHPSYDKLKPGMYTDDTQMSIGVTEVLLQEGGCNIDDFYRAWFDCFKRDPRDGYSRGMQKILEESTSVGDLRQRLAPISDKNGAAMRAVPIGVLNDPKDVVSIAALQAQTTHATYGGINSAVIVALMSHFALYEDREFIDFKEWGNQYCPALEHFTRPWVGPVHGFYASKDPTGLGLGMNTAWAVWTLLCEEKSLASMMQRIVYWGGDTDSVAAIAWGIASARYPNEVLPEFLERDLEIGGQYGVSYLQSLGKRLMDAYDVQK